VLANAAVRAAAGVAVVNFDTVADVQAVGGTVSPDRVLDKTRKDRGESRIKLAAINVARNLSDNVGAAAC
jgi:hypothetical protein